MFPGETTIWIDGSVQPKVDLAVLLKTLGDADIAMYRHPLRGCAYQEAEACIEFNKDRAEVIMKQMDRYESEGFPHDFGLVASGMVVCGEGARKLNEMWWTEISLGSKRDQLSFDYCRWRTGVSFKEIPGSIYDGNLCNLHRHRRT
jgi:hypothetical protein